MERPSTVSSVSPMAPSSARRNGFTLVELLAVIMIIAMLAGLLTPAVMKSMSSSRAAAVKAEIELLSTALMNYKNEYGSLPPSDMRGLWSGGAVDRTHPAYKHLQRIFPRISEVESNGVPNPGNFSPYYFMSQMSPAQALVFWLQGYFDNPQYPLTNNTQLVAATPRAGTATANRNKLFDFDESRLLAATAYWPAAPFVLPFNPVSSQEFFTRNAANLAGNAFARDYPVYFPGQANTGLPYVYFSSSSYSTSPTANVTSAVGNSRDLYYTAIGNGNTTAIAPYFNSSNCTVNPSQQSWAQLHMNPDTFQLIAAGADGTYGNLVSGFPSDCALTPLTSPLQPFPNSSQQIGPFTSVQNKDGTNPGHEDNITNFAIGRLKEAAERLSQ
ncbi:MAG: prepilin-type N-terminal cleavage/methylation domain-containing protein [Planctomycetota bacterium]|nr:MAG: prepilin-type N-terminal cleavage/methylation domain-containing protein [Planctomycetota bacterium]